MKTHRELIGWLLAKRAFEKDEVDRERFGDVVDALENGLGVAEERDRLKWELHQTDKARLDLMNELQIANDAMTVFVTALKKGQPVIVAEFDDGPEPGGIDA